MEYFTHEAEVTNTEACSCARDRAKNKAPVFVNLHKDQTVGNTKETDWLHYFPVFQEKMICYFGWQI